MKKIVLIILFSWFICYAQAQQKRDFDILPTDTLKIQLVGTKTGKISIGGNIKQKGDYYIANQEINWTDDKQYIKVRNISYKNRPFAFCKKDFKDFKTNDTYSWYFKKNYLSTKGLADAEKTVFENMTSLRVIDGVENCSCPHYMIEDTVRIKCWEPLDNQHGFIATTLPNGSEFHVPYIKTTNEIIITNQYLKSKGVNIGHSLKLYIKYYHKSDSKATIENVIIQYLPKI